MSTLSGSRFKKDRGRTERDVMVQKAGIVGVLGNFLLAAVKFVIGTASGSIAIMSDAVHNITDSGNSLLTIAANRFSERAPTSKHPYGYGRVEYIGGMIIAAIIIALGFEFFTNSIEFIRNPQPVSFSVIDLVLLVIAIIIKIGMAFYTKYIADKTNAPALKATSIEAFTDVFKSGVALVAAFVSYLTSLQIDGWAGLIISLFIMYAGFVIIREVFDAIIGLSADADLVEHITEDIKVNPLIKGVHDLTLHNYGPDRYTGSVYVEIEDHVEVGEIAPILSRIQDHILLTHDIYLVFGVYPINTESDRVNTIKAKLEDLVEPLSGVSNVHALYLDDEASTLRFDVLMDYSINDIEAKREEIADMVTAKFPGYEIFVYADRPYT